MAFFRGGNMAYVEELRAVFEPGPLILAGAMVLVIMVPEQSPTFS